MHAIRALGFVVLLGLMGCGATRGTEPPAEGWANNAPTRVEQVVEHEGMQLLHVSQGRIRTWVRVPAVGAKVGEYVLLGQGRLVQDADLPQDGPKVRELVDIEHVQVVDLPTAQRAVRARSPRNAVAIGTIYAELEDRADDEIVVVGTVVKAPGAVGFNWVHLQDGSGSAEQGTHDLTVKTSQAVTVGQRVAFRGVLRKDVDLGFGYHYDALVEDGVLIE